MMYHRNMNEIAYTTDPAQIKAHAIEGIKNSVASLNNANQVMSGALNALRDTVVRERTAGVLTVAQIAKAIGRDRNAVDAMWSAYGRTVKGKQTRVQVQPLGADDTLFAAKYTELELLADDHREAVNVVKDARARRDLMIAHVYEAKLLGPSAIADLACIDRNHVLRLVRKAGIAPAHRANPRNQYTVKRNEV